MRPPLGADARHARLLRRSRAGDRAAFRALYRELYPRVRAFARRRCGSEADSDDVVSRSFHRLLERLEQWDEARGAVLPFVLSIARNCIIDDLRARHDGVPADEAELIDPCTPHTELERAQALEALGEKLESLRPELRELFALRFGDGLSHRQIGELLGLSEAAVKQRFSRALRELREEMMP